MKLSISRDDDLTPEQPSIDENIAAANKMLDRYGRKLEKQYILDNGYWEYIIWKYRQLGRPKSMRERLLNIVIEQVLKQLGGGGIMEEVILDTLEALMDETDIDDKIYAKVAEVTKEKIPGDKYEPLIGRVFEGIGKELQKPVE